MLVLQASWSAALGELHLWAEDPAGPAHTRSRGADPRPHPFAASFEQLEGIVRTLLPAAAAAALEGEDLTVLLPSEARGPARSPALVPDAPADPRPPRGLAPWSVPTLFVPAEAAVDLLDSLVDLPVKPSTSLQCFAQLGRLAEAVVRRGGFAPALLDDRGEWVARWLPLRLHAAERAALRALERALPESARAVLPFGEDSADDSPSPATVMGAALDSLVDARVRRRVRVTPAAPGDDSLVAALLDSLGDACPTLDAARSAAIDALRAQLGSWLATAAGESDYTPCFRVVPPSLDEAPLDPDAEPWRIEFALEHRDDASLILSAEQIWQGSSPQGPIDAPALQEHLLRSLGVAARVHRPLQVALKHPSPTEHRTDADGAVDFLQQGRPLLEQAGFTVLVPTWWGGEASRLGLKARARSSSSGSDGISGGELTGRRLLSFRWTVALGDDDLTEEELRALAAAKAPLIQVRGRWVHLRADEIDAALHALSQTRDEAQTTDTIELLRLGSGLDAAPGGLPVLEVAADGALGALISGSGGPDVLPTPPGFEGSLRPYQGRGLGWLRFLEGLGLGACLADDMGLGKTIQVLSLLALERSDGSATDAGATLLVCPLSVVGNWNGEAARFVPTLDVYIHHGAVRLQGDALAARIATADLVITTYALATRDIDALGSRVWHRVVLDEAQAIKNRAARQSRAIRSLQTDRRVALTGTPVENRLSELHAIMEFLNPRLLGSPASFRRSFVLPVERDRQPQAIERLRRLTQPFVLRRLKTDASIALNLPDKIERTVECRLTREQATLYQAIVDTLEATLKGSEGMTRRGAILAALTRLKQACNHPAQLLADRSRLAGRSGKLARTEELLDEALAAGDKALLFTQYATMGGLLRERLQERFGVEVLLLHGGTSKAARDRMVARFQAANGPRLFVLSIKAGGTGLNLTAANHVIHFDRWWNPAVEDQATDRAFRIGQHRNVLVHKLVCVGTLEDRIDAMITRKKALADLVVGAGEEWLTELSLDALRAVIALSPDAVDGG